MFRFQRYLLDPDPADGGGGDTSPPPSPKPEPDLTKAIEGLLSRHGDAAGALRVLLSENHGYRDQIRELKAKLPASDAVVLSGDQAKTWGQYQALGSLDDLHAIAKERDELASQLKAKARRDLLNDAAARHGYDPEVLAQLPGIDDLNIELAESKIGSQTKQLARVVIKDGDSEDRIDLNDYAEKTWAKFLPSLTADGQASGPPKGTPPRRINPPPNLDSASRRPPVRLGSL